MPEIGNPTVEGRVPWKCLAGSSKEPLTLTALCAQHIIVDYSLCIDLILIFVVATIGNGARHG
jgi:hypothetical protein